MYDSDSDFELTKPFKQPIVFCHGLGLGIFFNLPFIKNISQGREIFVIDLSWISNRLGEKIPTP